MTTLAEQIDAWRGGGSPPLTGRYLLTTTIKREKVDKRRRYGVRSMPSLEPGMPAHVQVRTCAEIARESLAMYDDELIALQIERLGSREAVLARGIERLSAGGRLGEVTIMVGDLAWKLDVWTDLPHPCVPKTELPKTARDAVREYAPADALKLVRSLEPDASGYGVLAEIRGRNTFRWEDVLAAAIDAGEISAAAVRAFVGAYRKAHSRGEDGEIE